VQFELLNNFKYFEDFEGVFFIKTKEEFITKYNENYFSKEEYLKNPKFKKILDLFLTTEEFYQHTFVKSFLEDKSLGFINFVDHLKDVNKIEFSIISKIIEVIDFN
jgi:hypothetical protein